SPQNFSWQFSKCFSGNVFSPTVMNFIAVGERKHVVDQPVIQKWQTHFNRVCHRVSVFVMGNRGNRKAVYICYLPIPYSTLHANFLKVVFDFKEIIKRVMPELLKQR